MPRYIDAHVAESLIAEMAREPEYQHEDEDWTMGLCMAERAISETPTANVVEVVRCSECDHFLECGEEGYCIIMMRGTLKYGFCSSAVRKEKT